MCLKHGQGTDTFANGEAYTGDFVNGKAHGKGEYNWPTGAYYVGEFVQGKKEGKGKWKSMKGDQNCNTYEGDF